MKRKKYLTCSIICMITFIAIAIGAIFFPFNNTKKKSINSNPTAYISDQHEISTGNVPTENITRISITNMYNTDTNGIYTSATNFISSSSFTGLNNPVITIKNGKELDAFSKLCNSSSNYLNKDYMLLNDVDYNDAANYSSQFIPIGWSGTAFSGTFNGNGYEIEGLSIITINSSNEDTYNNIHYISMFASNEGTISKLGLYNTNIIQTIKLTNTIGVAPLCGQNNGNISNCYVVDDRDAAKRQGGISASGGYSIAGLVYDNKSALVNCYTKYNILVNYAVTDYIDFREICNINTGTMTNVYFCNNSILTIDNPIYDSGTYKYTSGIVEYNPGLVGINHDASILNIYGHYARNLAALNEAFTSIDGWYTSLSNPSVDFGYSYPSLIGLQVVPLTNNYTFKISSALDFAYIFTLANKNSYFASSSVTYVLQNDINLANIDKSSYVYDDFFSAKFTGVTNLPSTSSSITLSSGYKATTPTIYGASILNSIAYSGYDCYGLFPLLDGEVSNINIYLDQTVNGFKTASSNSLTKAIGIVSGFCEGGTIQNVNVYGNINLTTTEASNYNFGRYLAGGVVGVVSRDANVKTVTANGAINGSVHNYSSSILSSPSNGYVPGNSLGGIIGYSLSSVGEISKCLSNIDITATVYNSSSYSSLQHIGGVVGSGYTSVFKQLFNKGNITLGTQSNNNLGTVYASGIMGRYLGITSNDVTQMHNQGDITFSFTSAKTAYLSGVFNADILTVNNDTLTSSKLKTLNASGLSNSGNIVLNNYLTMTTALADNLNIYNAGVVYLKASNDFKSNLNGVYNLAYKYNDNYSKDYSNVTDMQIDLASLKEYAPCVISDANSINGLSTINTVYNLRNIDYVTNQLLMFSDVKYSGCLSGKYMTVIDAKNEGNLNFAILKNASRALNYSGSSYKTFKIYGLLEEINSGCSATNLYNGGNIDFFIGNSSNQNLSVYYNLYISGICYANRNQFQNDSEYEAYNPLNENYDKSLQGSLNNVINNGSITASNYSTENGTTYAYTTVVTSSISSTGYLKGSSIIAGICNINESVISTTYNLGKLTNRNYIVTPTGNYSYINNFSIETGGISYKNIGKYSQIRDSANNGNIQSINASSINGYVHSGGISVLNDELENGTDYYNATNALHHLQLICFTINYGEVMSFSYADRITAGSTVEPQCKASGVIVRGLCSVLNAVNYGNIYGSEAVAGMFGVIEFYKFQEEVSVSNPVTIANSINYGNAKATRVILSPSGSPYAISYNEVKGISFGSEYLYLGLPSDKNYVGALISIINYASTVGGSTAASTVGNISIRYLINFNNASKIINSEIAQPVGVLSAPETLVSATYPDTYMGKQVTYAPLTSIDDESGNIGVFSKNFKFRKAIEGEIDETILTDKYIPDYFSFVGFTKINENLLETIGWRSLAYADAADSFAINLSSLSNLLTNYKSVNNTKYNEIVTNALATSTWINNCDPSVLSTLVDDLLSTKDTDGLKDVITYLFFNSSSSNSITKAMKESVINQILDTLDTSKANIINLLDNLMYNDLLAEIIAKSDSEYAAIQNLITTDLEALSTTDLTDLVETYINYLSDVDNDFYDTLFASDTMSQARQNTIETLLTGIDDSILEDLIGLLDSSEYSAKTLMTYALESMTNAQKNTLYLGLLANNNFESMATTITAILRRMNIASYTEPTDTTVINSFETNLNDDYVDLWNMIKENSSFQQYLRESVLDDTVSADGVTGKGIYALATEFRNAYQSNDAPAPNGRVRATTTGANLNTRFIFTPDSLVSNSTYFYGPYQQNGTGSTATYTKWNSDGSTADGGTNSTSTNTGSSNQYYELSKNEVAAGSNAKQLYVPIFISLDKDYIDTLIAGTTNPVSYKFFWNNVPSINASQCAQWVHEYCIDNAADNNAYVLLKNYSYQSTYFYNFTNVGTTTTTTETSINTSGVTNKANLTYNGTTGLAYNQFLYSYCSASIITGVYYQQDQWDGKSSFMTAKSNQGIGVVTTQYIDYSLNDLLLLDGIRTKGSSSGISSDEVNIINNLMTEVLSTAAGKSAAMTATGEAITSSTSYLVGPAEAYMNALANDQTFVNEYLSNSAYISSSYNLYYNASHTPSFREYLISISEGLSFTAKQRIIMAAMDSKSNFSYVVNYLLDESKGYNAYLNNSALYAWLAARDSDELEFVSKRISELINLGYTEQQISNYLSGVSTTEINSFISSYPIISAVKTGIIGDYITLGSNFNGIINPITYNNEYYSSALNVSSNSTMNYNNSSASTLNILATGSGTITVNGITRTVNNTPNVYSWTGLAASTNYTINVSTNVNIYNTEYETDVLSTQALDITYNGWSIVQSQATINGTAYTEAIVGNVGDTVLFTNPTTSTKYVFFAISGGTFTANSGNVNAYTTLASYNYRTSSSVSANSGTRTFTVATNPVYLYKSAYGNSGGSTISGTMLPSNTVASSTIGAYAFTGGIKVGNTIYGMTSTKTISATTTGTTVSLVSSAASTITLVDGANATYTRTVSAGGTATFTGITAGNITIKTSATSNITNITESTTTVETSSDKMSDYTNQGLANTYTNYYEGNYSSNEITQGVILELGKTQYKSVKADDMSLGTYVSTKMDPSNNFSFNGTIDNYINSIVGTTTLCGRNYTRYITLNGAGNTSYRNVSFSISSNSTIVVYAKGPTNSSIILNVGGTTYSQKATSNGNAYIFKASASNATTCYLYGTADTYLYEIFVYNDANTLQSEYTNNYAWVNNLSTIPSALTGNGGLFSDYALFVEMTNKYLTFNGTARDVANLAIASKADYIALAGLLYGRASNNVDNQLFNYLSAEQLIEFMNAVLSKDETAFGTYLTYCNDDNIIKSMIDSICNSNSNFYRELINNYVAEMNADINTDFTDAQKLLYASAYLGCDFSVNLNGSTLLDSEMYELLDLIGNLVYEGVTFDPQFILTASEINNDTFLTLMKYLGFNLSTEGYGIYAVSSSNGILNGEFLPDNISLSGMDATYDYNQEHSIFELTSDEEGPIDSSSSWRGGTSSNDDSIADVTSVNYAFYVLMKQLKLSIATNVFELELISTDGTTIITTPEGLIDNTNKVIDFYLASNADGNNKTYIINTANGSYSLSYMASMTNTGGSINASSGNSGLIGSTTIEITAEDTTVKTIYTINLYKSIAMSMSLNSSKVDNSNSGFTTSGTTYTINNSVSATSGALALTFTTTNIPNYTDLSDMITIDGENSNSGRKFIFATTPLVTTTLLNFDLVNKTWGTGSVTIDFSFLDTLSNGNHTVLITLSSSCIYTVIFNRDEATGNSITSMVLDGTIINVSNTTINTFIPFGRGYSYEELHTVTNNCPLFLDSITLSPRATIVVSNATMSTTGANSNNVYSDGIITYTLTYQVTSESGSMATYTHNLIETDPFGNAKDGEDYPTSYSANTSIYYVQLVKDGEILTVPCNADGEYNLEFEREDENLNELTPKYRFNYYLDLFYVSAGSISSYLSVGGSQASSGSVVYFSAAPKFYGFYLNFYEDAIPGDYNLNLIYTNDNNGLGISWNGTTYTRVMTCPTITITKKLSTDADLKEIHFIQSAGQLSDTATITSLTEVYASVGTGHDYADLIASPESDVVANVGRISYNTQEARNATEYYIVGTVSGATLSTYAPTFVIKSYAKIYQYKKFATSYVNGFPSAYDTTRYLYVEFTYEAENGAISKAVFLVDESFTDVYTTDATWDNNTNAIASSDKIGTINNKSFNYNGITYTISDVAGTSSEENTGLNMDYIGNPAENHFWYVDYAIFAEAYDQSTSRTDYVKEYHIAVLDLTNSVRFVFNIVDNSTTKIELNALYLSINTYKAFTSGQTTYLEDPNGLYANDEVDTSKVLKNTISGLVSRIGITNTFGFANSYNLQTYGFQTLPYGYYYFYLDLPDGYGCTYEITTQNKTNADKQWTDDSYLPPASIVTQTVEVTISIQETASADFNWGEKVIAVIPQLASKHE